MIDFIRENWDKLLAIWVCLSVALAPPIGDFLKGSGDEDVDG